MPFDKDPLSVCAPRGRLALGMAILLVAASLLAVFLAMRLFPARATEAMMGDVLESDSVVAFLGLEDAE